jgi:anti-sigma factor RsiW
MDHINEIAPDFVLGLLPQEERRKVISHIVDCESCRLTITNERNLMEEVRKTLQRVSNHNPQRIRSLMPAIHKRSWPAFNLSIVRPVAVAFAIILVAVGGFMINMDKSGLSRIHETPTHSIATSVNTETPTSTAAATTDKHEEGGINSQRSFLFISGSSVPQPQMTPEPLHFER